MAVRLFERRDCAGALPLQPRPLTMKISSWRTFQGKPVSKCRAMERRAERPKNAVSGHGKASPANKEAESASYCPSGHPRLWRLLLRHLKGRADLLSNIRYVTRGFCMFAGISNSYPPLKGKESGLITRLKMARRLRHRITLDAKISPWRISLGLHVNSCCDA